MSIQSTGFSGSALRIATNITTTALSVFMRIRKGATTSPSAQWAVLVSTAAGSDLNGHGVYPNESAVTEGRSINGLRFNAESFNLIPVADWGDGSVVGELSNDVWANLAIIFYLNGSSRPEMKVAYRDHPSGSLATAIVDPRFSFTNALVRFGAGHAAGNALIGYMADAIIYNSAITSDVDILAEFDSQGANGTPWASYAFRGEASVTAAANDESGNGRNLTVEGATLSVSAIDPTFGPTLTGGGQLPAENTGASAPNAPATLAVSGYSSSAVVLSFGTNGNAAGTRYEVEYRESGGSTWTAGGESDASPIAVTGLNVDTTYETRMRATNAGGSSGYVTGPTQKTKKLLARGYVNQAAVNKTGVTAQIFREGVGSALAGDAIITQTSQAFESSAENDPSSGVLSARIDVAIAQVGEPQISNGDTVRMVLTADTPPDDLWSPIFDATVVEID